MNDRHWILLAALVLLMALPVRGGDGEEIEPPEDKPEVEILTGGQASDTDGTLTRVAEYSVVDNTYLSGLKWRTSPFDDTTLGFTLFRVSSDEFKGAAELDLNRRLRIKGTLDGFIHRLVHDPIDNLQSVSEVKVVRRTDFDPGTDYQVNNRIFDVKAEFQPPSTPGFSFRAGYSHLERKGTRQHLTTSHCTSCHTTSQGRDIDESTADSELGVHLTTGKIDLDYKVYGTDYNNSSRTAVAPYESAIHPGNQNDALFDDRVWFQGGLNTVSNIPNVSRLGHQLKLRAGFGQSSAVNFTAVQSETQNKRTNLEYEFGALRGRYTTRLGKKWRLNVYGQYQELENDTYFVDLVALNGLAAAPIAGPPGYTTSFQDWRRSPTGGNDPNAVFNSFTRYSGMNRTQARAGLDAVWRAVRRGSMRLGYKYQQVDRDNVVLASGDGVTTSHTLKFGWNQRWRNRLRWNNSLRYTDTDNPYVNLKGGLRLFSGSVEDGIVNGNPGSPKSPLSLQYYQLHELRAANLSSSPSSDFSLRSTATWGPKRARWSVGANVRYRDAENDELQYTEWQRDDVGAGVNFWIAAAPKVRLMVGVDSSRQETNSEVIVPVMDG